MQESIYYIDHSWPELKKYAEDGAVIILPMGQIEEHGPHLPVGTDYHISKETARMIAEKASEEMPVLVMPTVWTGYSGKGLSAWPGLISLPTDVVSSIIEHTIVSLTKSGFRKVVVLNSHGHHEGILRVAARNILDRCNVALVISHIWRMAEESMQKVRESADGGCSHAGEYETSLMLAWDKRVDMTKTVDEPVKPASEFVGGDIITRHNAKVFWSTWGHSKSKSGTFGCPSLATKEKGEYVAEETMKEYLKLLRDLNNSS